MEAMNRREFVLSSAAAAAAAATTAGVSFARADEAVPAVVDLGLPKNFDHEQKIIQLFPEAHPIAPVAAPAAWDYEADVVIVGSGFGGLVAAMKCADLGAKVVVLEKLPDWGGNSKMSSYLKCFGGTKAHARNGFTDYETYVSQVVPAVFNTMYTGLSEEGMGREFMLNALTREPAVFDWLEEQGAKWTLDTDYSTGEDDEGGEGMGSGAKLSWDEPTNHLSELRNKMTIDFMYNRALELGVEFMFSTRASALVMEDGVVIGVMAVDDDDATVYAKGAQGVLLASGGCVDNRDMLSVFMARIQACRIGHELTQMVVVCVPELVLDDDASIGASFFR